MYFVFFLSYFDVQWKPPRFLPSVQRTQHEAPHPRLVHASICGYSDQGRIVLIERDTNESAREIRCDIIMINTNHSNNHNSIETRFNIENSDLHNLQSSKPKSFTMNPF